MSAWSVSSSAGTVVFAIAGHLYLGRRGGPLMCRCLIVAGFARDLVSMLADSGLAELDLYAASSKGRLCLHFGCCWLCRLSLVVMN